jgi:hypothetical protein
MPSITIPSPRSMARLADTVRRGAGRNRPLPPQPSSLGRGPGNWFYGELLADVAAPGNGWTGATKGYAKIMVPDPDSTDDPVHFKEFGTGPITDASNADPIVITSAGHGLRPGRPVYVKSVTGNTAANGFHQVGAVTSNTFELVGAAGSGAYAAGGTWYIALPFVNRDPSLSGTAGAMCKLEYGFGEWSITWASC